MSFGHVGIDGTDYRREHRIDRNSGAQYTLDFGHHETHDGDMYSVFVLGNPFNKSDVISLAFMVPDILKVPHLEIFANSTANAQYDLLEAPTITNGSGSLVPIRNRNRVLHLEKRSAMLSIEAVQQPGLATANGTITDDGDAIDGDMIGGARAQGGSIGSTRSDSEWVIMPNVVYCARLTGNGTGADNSIASLKMVWYEHAPKINLA